MCVLCFCSFFKVLFVLTFFVFLVSVGNMRKQKQQRTNDVFVRVLVCLSVCICRLLFSRTVRWLHYRSCLQQNEKRDVLDEKESRSDDTQDINGNVRRDKRRLPFLADRDSRHGKRSEVK